MTSINIFINLLYLTDTSQSIELIYSMNFVFFLSDFLLSYCRMAMTTSVTMWHAQMRTPNQLNPSLRIGFSFEFGFCGENSITIPITYWSLRTNADIFIVSLWVFFPAVAGAHRTHRVRPLNESIEPAVADSCPGKHNAKHSYKRDTERDREKSTFWRGHFCGFLRSSRHSNEHWKIKISGTNERNINGY